MLKHVGILQESPMTYIPGSIHNQEFHNLSFTKYDRRREVHVAAAGSADTYHIFHSKMRLYQALLDPGTGKDPSPPRVCQRLVSWCHLGYDVPVVQTGFTWSESTRVTLRWMPRRQTGNLRCQISSVRWWVSLLARSVSSKGGTRNLKRKISQ